MDTLRKLRDILARFALKPWQVNQFNTLLIELHTEYEDMQRNIEIQQDKILRLEGICLAHGIINVGNLLAHPYEQWEDELEELEKLQCHLVPLGLLPRLKEWDPKGEKFYINLQKWSKS